MQEKPRKRVSCHERLKQLRKELNYDSSKNKPQSGPMPVIHLKADKQMNKVRKQMKKKEKSNRAAIALDLLYNVFERWYAEEIMQSMPYDELVDYVIDYVKTWQKQLTDFDITEPEDIRAAFGIDNSPKQKFKSIEEEEDDTFDIPDSQWDAYVKYEKKHKPKNIGDVFKLREKFKHIVEKTRKKYKKRGLAIYDPLFRHSRINEQHMVKNLKLISKENEMRTQQFAKMMNKLVGDDPVNQKLLKSFEAHTKAVIKNVNKQLKDMKKSAPKIPVPFSFS